MSISRRTFIRLAGIGALSLGASGILTSCAGDQAASSTTPQNTDQVIVTMTKSSEPASGFDPLYTWGCGEHVHEPLIQSTLITTDIDMHFENDLATDYHCSEDGLTWTFNIRDDVSFTDGEPLTASDVAFTINGIRTNEAAQADLSMVERAIAVSDTCVEVHLFKPFSAMLYTLAVVGIVPEHAYDAETYGENPIGSGRYMLEQWDKGQQVILKANPDYYGTAPLMDRLVVLFMDEDASLAAAQSGQVDVAYTAATLVDSADPKGFSVLNCASVDSRGISLPSVLPGKMVSKAGNTFHVGNAVTADVAVRQAINYAVNRSSMIDDVLNGYGTPAYSSCDGMAWYNPQMQVEEDRARARKILEDAGWVPNAHGVYEKDGMAAAFDLYYPSGDSVRQALAHQFANQMADLGIDVHPVAGAWTYDEDGIYAHQYSDPVLWGWGANSPIQMYNLHYGPSNQNYASYDDPVVNSYMDAALAASDSEAGARDWKLSQWDGKEGFAPQGAATWVWLCNIDHLYFKRDGLYVAPQKPHPHGHGWSLVNNVDLWYWE